MQLDSWIRRSNGVILVAVLGLLSACNGGGGSPQPNPLRPTITGLSQNAADFNDAVEIFGSHFGNTQGTSRAALNGQSFSVVEWTDARIKVTVSDGMTSGIVVVTVGGLSSQSGSEAQLFIPAAPGGQALIDELTPDSGRPGEDQILIAGQGFGASSANGQVLFTTPAELSLDGLVQANVVHLDVAGTPQEQWTHSLIKVYVPATAITGPVYVVVNGLQSNAKQFTAQANSSGLPTPAISGFAPQNGEAGTVVTLSGSNFGPSQGGSVITLAGQQLTVATWTDTEVVVVIPPEASTGRIRIVVSGQAAETADDFIVANQPVITGVSPAQLRVGQKVTIYGQYFGDAPGSGSVRIGATDIAASAVVWHNTRLDITELPFISFTDADAIPVIVTADSGLASGPFTVSLVSSLTGQVTVNPAAGIQNTAPGAADGTAFVFTTEVAGGDGPFVYSLLPNSTNPGLATPESDSGAITYYYDSPGVYSTAVRVRDASSGTTVLIDGPTVMVVGTGEPVVTAIVTGAFSRAQDAPNDYCYILDNANQPLYYNFYYLPTETVFASNLLLNGANNPMEGGIPRDLRSFLDGQTDPRPIGYRYGSGPQGAVVLHGLNFGTASGQIWLNSSWEGDGFAVDPQSILSWTDTQISFLLPDNAAADLSGQMTIQAGSGHSFTTSAQLLCAPYITSLNPATDIGPSSIVTVQGYDLALPPVARISGSQTFVFVVLQVAYRDPWDDTPQERLALKVEPLPVQIIGGNSFTLDMSLLSGQQEVEVFDTAEAPHTKSRLVQGTPVTGAGTSWYFFIWNGALASGTENQQALSGVFSEAYELKLGTPVAGVSTISGHVQDSNGDPLAGVTISLTGGLSATTDAAGDYTVADVPDGTATLTPSLAGTPAWFFVPASRNVTVPPDATGVDFTGTQGVGPNMTISGLVQIITKENPPPNPPDFAPLPGATVTIYAGETYPPAGEALDTTTSDANGEYTFEVPIGDTQTWYTIEATHPSYPHTEGVWVTFWTVVQGGSPTPTANPLTVNLQSQ